MVTLGDSVLAVVAGTLGRERPVRVNHLEQVVLDRGLVDLRVSLERLGQVFVLGLALKHFGVLEYLIKSAARFFDSVLNFMSF